MILYYIGSFLSSVVFVAVMVPLVKKWAVRVGFLDFPAGVKTHATPTPLGGGLAVYVGLAFSITIMLAAVNFDIPRGIVGIIAGTSLAVLIGLYDDYFEMGPLLKISGELIAAIIFLNFIEKFPPIISFLTYILLASIWIIGIQNAINFIDNLDGMCGGISLTIAVGFGVLFVLKGMPFYAVISFAVAGGALGFLLYNLPPASIFLGDGGSLLFGFALACLGIVHLNTSKSLAAALSPILIMAFPIFDMTLVTLTRLNKGRKVYVASKDHAWDMINVLGLTREATVNSVILINLVLVSSGILLFFIEKSPFQMLIVVGFALLLAFIGTQLSKNFLFVKYNILKILTDLFAINLSFILYYLIKYKSGLMAYTTIVPLSVLAVPLAWINLFWIILFSGMGLYDVSFERRFSRQVWIILKSVLVGLLIFLFLNLRSEEGFQISIISLSVFIGLLIIMTILFRGGLYMYISSRLRQEGSKLNAIILNLGKRIEDIKGSVFAGKYRILGSLDSGDVGIDGSLGNISDMNRILKETRTARIILNIESSDFRDLRGIFASPYYMESVFLAPAGNKENLKGLKRISTVYDGLDMISPKHRRLFLLIVRRLVDLFVSVLILAILSPIWAARILMIKTKGEPVWDDLDIVNREERKTGIRFFAGDKKPLRLTNPFAMLAVVSGNLSLYGATAASYDDYTLSMVDIPGYWKKFLVKPGIFGPGYDGRNARERFDLDMVYLEKTSTFGDIMMILRGLLGISFMREKQESHA